MLVEDTNYSEWSTIYRLELLDLYGIMCNNLFKNNIPYNKTTELFSNFCYIIYIQSSRQINKYDKEAFYERSLYTDGR